MFPKTGNKLHDGLDAEYTIAIAAALRSHLGESHRAAKTIMRWTGASERTAKNWLGGTLGPSGCNLIRLARESDAVMSALLLLAGRDSIALAADLRATRTALSAAMEAIDRALCTGDAGLT